MDDEPGKQLASEVEANLVALRLKKQLDAYRDNWETIVGCQFIAGVIAFVAILAFVNGKFDAGVAFFITSAAALVVLPTCNRSNLQAWKRMALPLPFHKPRRFRNPNRTRTGPRRGRDPA
jgi:hypothetical protein